MMRLIGFLQAQNCTGYVGSWRNPSSMTDFLSANYFQRIARTLEDARFDLAFFDDRLAMPDTYGRSHYLAVQHGIKSIKLDPTVVMMTMAMATTHLGLGSTYSTTYYQPYHVARLFATLDLMSGGRIAWNIVTSLNDSEAAHFGVGKHLDHDLRYDRADEFLSLVTELWSTWDRDALLLDKSTGTFADPTKVHRTQHSGKFFKLDGTFTVPSSSQGQPVLLQAGSSGRGLSFAGRWAEVIFTTFYNKELGVKHYTAARRAVADAGRDPDSVLVAPLIGIIVGETEEIARRKADFLRNLGRPEDVLALLCEVLNVDFADRPLDEAFTDEELENVLSSHGLRDRVITLSGKTNPSVQDFVQYSGWGTLHEGSTFVGTPTQIADYMEDWFGTCCDAFVIGASTVPGTYEDFARLVVPELQRRGLVRTQYAGTTLRENLGLETPQARQGHHEMHNDPKSRSQSE
jgi:FMN-dependent oxidoreductase (nitrilotriacetate monooxygenase family)